MNKSSVVEKMRDIQLNWQRTDRDFLQRPFCYCKVQHLHPGHHLKTHTWLLTYVIIFISTLFQSVLNSDLDWCFARCGLSCRLLTNVESQIHRLLRFFPAKRTKKIFILSLCTKEMFKVFSFSFTKVRFEWQQFVLLLCLSRKYFCARFLSLSALLSSAFWVV